MKKNIGRIDAIIRIVIFAVIAILYFTHQIEGTAGIVLLVVGVILLATAFLGWCGLYALMGCNTCQVKEAKK